MLLFSVWDDGFTGCNVAVDWSPSVSLWPLGGVFVVEGGGVLACGAVGEGLPISPLFDGFDLDFIGSALFDPLFLSTPISRGFPLLGRSKL